MQSEAQIVNYTSLRKTLDKALGASAPAKFGVVLEFGSGKTGFAHLYGKDAQDSIAVDLHDYREYWEGLGVRYLMSDGNSIPLEDDSVDLIVSH